MSYTFLNDLDSAVFDRFSAAHPLGNMMQTSGWARLKKEWDSAYCGVKQDGQLIAAALVLFARCRLATRLRMCRAAR